MAEDGFKHAAGFAYHMQGRIFIQNAPKSIDVEGLRTNLDTEGCGAIVSFVGITRGMDGDEEVLRLEFDAWQEKLSETLYSLAEGAIERILITFGSNGSPHRFGWARREHCSYSRG